MSTAHQETPQLPNVRLEGAKNETFEEKFRNEMERRLHTQDSPALKEIQKVEQGPTPEETETIQLVDYWTNALLKRYGVAPIHIPPHAVHILSPDNLPRGWETDINGRFYSNALSIAVVRQSGQYPFAHINFHEMLHAKSRLSARFKDKESEPFPKRLGLNITGREPDDRSISPEYFRWMNEAVIEELTKIFVQACIRAGKWRTEYQSTQAILSGPDVPEKIKTNQSDCFFASKRPQSFIDRSAKKPQNQPAYEVAHYGYPEDRTALNILITTLYEKNRDQFQSREQVFDVFARTMLDDNFLPLGRLIERTLGKGSFKKIGSLGSIDELHSLIWAAGRR